MRRINAITKYLANHADIIPPYLADQDIDFD